MRMFEALLRAIDKQYTYAGFAIICLVGIVIWLYGHEIGHEGWLFWVVVVGFIVLCATMNYIAGERRRRGQIGLKAKGK